MKIILLVFYSSITYQRILKSIVYDNEERIKLDLALIKDLINESNSYDYVNSVNQELVFKIEKNINQLLDLIFDLKMHSIFITGAQIINNEPLQYKVLAGSQTIETPTVISENVIINSRKIDQIFNNICFKDTIIQFYFEQLKVVLKDRNLESIKRKRHLLLKQYFKMPQINQYYNELDDFSDQFFETNINSIIQDLNKFTSLNLKFIIDCIEKRKAELLLKDPLVLINFNSLIKEMLLKTQNKDYKRFKFYYTSNYYLFYETGPHLIKELYQNSVKTLSKLIDIYKLYLSGINRSIFFSYRLDSFLLEFDKFRELEQIELIFNKNRDESNIKLSHITSYPTLFLGNVYKFNKISGLRFIDIKKES